MECVEYNGRKIEYEIIRKNVKNINLRVRRDASVVVSANKNVPKFLIEKFINDNAERILISIDRISSAGAKADFKKSSEIKLLGMTYKLVIERATVNSYFIGENTITFYVREPDDDDALQDIYNSLLRNTAEVVFPKLINDCFAEFKDLCKFVPDLKIKDLKSQWGNCYHKRNLITLNLRLAVYDINVIKSVVYHEYCHFAHQNHSKDFYNLLETVMPEWKKYNKILKQK